MPHGDPLDVPHIEEQRMRQTAVALNSKGALLEGAVAAPESEEAPSAGVVICHPHPLFGGNMDNPLVLALQKAVVDRGLLSLRFNFRGVGNSEGPSTGGNREPEDVAAALALLRHWKGSAGSPRGRGRSKGPPALGVVGYSFGAAMAVAAIGRLKPARAFVLISPPVNVLDNPVLLRDKRPKLFLTGDRDRLVPGDSLRERVDPLPEPRELILVSGADHSWRGYEAVAAQHAAQFLARALGA